MSAERCKGATKSGKPCRAYAVEGSKYCQAHDPALAAQRAAWRKAGGLRRAVPEGEPVDLMTVEDVRKGLAALIGSTWEQANTPARTRALTSAYQLALSTFTVGELEQRLEALEAMIGRSKA